MANPTKVSFESLDVASTFESYPDKLRDKLLELRQLIFETALALDIDDLEETLKWGEPSYLTKNGSTVRIAWRKSFPEQYSVFFNCKTSLIETFREIYPDTFNYEGSRAIVFDENDRVPIDALKHCIELSLSYHKIKHLPMLGL
ncbi:MAG TPA: DUF1801 domain-containing protein [Leucothrix sp.]|nr:DUF1801 domain-containing protein [Leucothrix sp.]